MELEGNGLIEYNPLFLNFDTWDFSYEENSPCIDAGDPSDIDPDGSARDIGARWYSDEEAEPSDCNSDSIQNVLDVVYLINDCKKYGTLPFAGIARAAFIYTKILRTLLFNKVITEKDYQAFYESIKTVTQEMFISLKKNRNK